MGKPVEGDNFVLSSNSFITSSIMTDNLDLDIVFTFAKPVCWDNNLVTQLTVITDDDPMGIMPPNSHRHLIPRFGIATDETSNHNGHAGFI